MKSSDLLKGILSERVRLDYSGILEEETISLKGSLIIEIFDPNKIRIIRLAGENLIVNSAGVLLAELIKNENVPGVTHLALGTGDPMWNPLNPPAPARTVSSLESEIYRQVVGSTQYVDPGGSPSLVPTNRVDFVFNIGPTDANGALMEMGLFGGLGASITNSGRMVNVFRFPQINKLPGFTLVVTWRLTMG